MDAVQILITAKDLASPAFARTAAGLSATERAARKLHRTAAVGTLALIGLGAESVKMASNFDASMTLLNTQAGVAKNQMGTLRKGVLRLAGTVGQDPNSLAESLFHVESNFESMGISSKKALSLVETAAKGATVGHAGLVDVTNALTAAVASGIPGVQNFDKAMGVLNATVGVGDMKMSDLAAAFGSGMVATVKGFGLNINDVGAALAVFGDNNIRGAAAGTQLRMSVMALAHPVATAGDSLKKLGLTQTTLAKDMQKGGLKLALEDLVGRMRKAGISSKEQGQIITEAFGRKAGAGLNVLVSQFDRLESKYPALAEGANKFGDAWKNTQKTFKFQTKQLQGSLDALMITVGTKLIPPLQTVVSTMLDHKKATVGVAVATAGLLAATIAVSGAMKVAAAAQVVWTASSKGFAALRGVFETVALKALYMREAFITAGGGVAGLKAAFASLGKVGKASVVIGGLALLTLAVMKIAGLGKTAPPDIDKLTTSLKQLASSGSFSGELHKTFGNMNGLIAKVRELDAVSKKTAESQKGVFGFRIPGLDTLADKVANSINNMSKGGHSLDALKGDFKSLDDALAGMAQGGYAKAAAKDFDSIRTAMLKAGYSISDVNKLFPNYKDSLAGLKAEQKLTADSMGLMGDAAVATQGKLDAEALSAKGLEQSIMALNEVHRGAFDAETAFYQAIADGRKALKENGKTLNEHTDAGRKNRDVLSQIAARTEDLVDKKLKEKVAWSEVDKTYKEGRKNLLDLATSMTGSKTKAKALVDELLKAPSGKKFTFEVDKENARKGIKDFNAAVRKTPKSKSVTLTTLSKSAEQVLKSFGLKVKRLPNGSVRVSAANGQALSAIGNVQAAVNRLHGKTITIMTQYFTAKSPSQLAAAHGRAMGGLAPGYAGGGSVLQSHPFGGLVSGPGTSMSDSILEISPTGAPYRTSDREYIVNAQQTKRYLPLLEAINAGTLHLPGYARGGLTKAQKAARARAQAEREARNEVRGELTLSYFGTKAGYKNDEFKHALGMASSLGDLVDSLNKWRSEIKKTTHGVTESRLLHALDKAGKSLIGYEKKLSGVNAALDKAKDKLASLKDAAAQLKDSVKSGIISGANITQAAGAEESRVTINTLLSQARGNTANAQGFAVMLKQLAKRGLSKDLIAQIAQAGVEGGGMETAQAILGGSNTQIKELNRLQGQLEKAAGSAGKTASDAMYAAGIKAADGLVKGLESKQKAIEKQMLKIAKAMEKAIKHALGIHSPSKLMEPIGALSMEGIEVGWQKRLAHHQSSFGRRPTWASMLNAPRHTGAPAFTPVPAVERPLVLHVSLGGREFGKIWVDVGRKEVSTRGGLTATLGS